MKRLRRWAGVVFGRYEEASVDFNARQELYRQIEAVRGRPLICYVTSLRSNASGQMAQDVIPEIARQIAAINGHHDAVDILIISNGGDPTVAWRVMSMLRERFEQVGVLIPFTAFSAATLLALGANDIVMHPFANLGPVDPQLTTMRPDNSGQQRFSSEDLTHFLHFVREDVGITDQRELMRAFEMLCRDVGALPVGAAKRSTQLSLSLGEKLLTLHMHDRNEARAIAESLNRSFYHHGYPVGRSEAREIGLPVNGEAAELEALMWQTWLAFEQAMSCTDPFIPLSVVLDDETVAALLEPVPQVQLPQNLPPAVANQAYGQIMQQMQVVNVPPVDYPLLLAAVESARCRSEYVSQLKLNAVRRPDLNITVNVSVVSEGWTFHAE